MIKKKIFKRGAGGAAKFLIQSGVIAAVYAVITLALMPLSYGVMQIRVSEALTVLPYFTPAAVPGLFAGCLISNLLSPYGLIDVVIGSAASLIAAAGSRLLRRRPLLVPLPPVLVNAVMVGGMLRYVYAFPMNLWMIMAWVALGQAAACYGIGYPLMRYLRRYKNLFRI